MGNNGSSCRNEHPFNYEDRCVELYLVRFVHLLVRVHATPVLLVVLVLVEGPVALRRGAFGRGVAGGVRRWRGVTRGRGRARLVLPALLPLTIEHKVGVAGTLLLLLPLSATVLEPHLQTKIKIKIKQKKLNKRN